MPQSASEAVRKATGAEPDEQLDHLISLELGGSNDQSNLNLEKENAKGVQPSLTSENAIAQQVANGEISYIDGQKAIARLKGVKLPDDANYDASAHPLASAYPKPNSGSASAPAQVPAPVRSSIDTSAPSLPFKAPGNASSTTAIAPNPEAGTTPGLTAALQSAIANFAPFNQLARMAGGENFFEALQGSMKGQSLTAEDIDKATARTKQLIFQGVPQSQAAKQALTEAKNQKMQATALASIGPEEDLADVGRLFESIAHSSSPTEIASILKKVPGVVAEDVPTLSKALTKVSDPEAVKNVIDSVAENTKPPAQAGITAEQTASLEATGRKATQSAIEREGIEQSEIRGANALEEKINTEPAPKPDSLLQKLKNKLTPLKGQDKEVQAAYETYQKKLAVGKQLANTEAKPLSHIGEAEGLDTILRYERGSATPYTGQIKDQFENLYDEARSRGIDVGHRPNYLPHAYGEAPEEIKEIVSKYLEKKGVAKEEIQAYLDGAKELSPSTARRLGVTPSFAKIREFPTYQEAINAGLHPKYTHPAQLAGFYRDTMERTVAAKEFVEELVGKGKLVTAEIAPDGYKPVNLEFSPKGYYAKPRLADMLNGLFKGDDTFGQAMFRIGAKASKMAQEITLSAGIPRTQVNFFSFGQAIKEMTAGNFKAIGGFLRSNLDTASIRWFEEKAPLMRRMADQGLDLGDTIAGYQHAFRNMLRPTIRDAAETGGVKSVAAAVARQAGEQFDKAFNQKVFASFIPQLYIQTFEDAANRFVAQGIPQAEADNLATQTVRAFHGLMENVGRAPGTEDVLSSAFFAPKFREGIINTLMNTAKSVTTEIRNPAFYKNRRLLAGMALSYGLYAAANKAINGHYIWQNPNGHEFDLQIPLPDGNLAYVPFMPSFLSLPRNLASGAIAIPKGDFSTATQKVGSLFSAPLELVSQVYTNRDYFGRAIYSDTDSTKVKVEKIATYSGLATTHPFIKELVNQLQHKYPLYQSITAAMELPVKYGSQAKNNTGDWYDANAKLQADRAAATAAFRPTFDKIQNLIQQGDTQQAQQLVNNLSDSDYALYKNLKSSGARSDSTKADAQFLPTFRQIQTLISQGKNDEAQQMVNGLSDTDYKTYQRLKKTGVQ